MIRQVLFAPIITLLMVLLSASALAQEVFDDPDGQYTLTLPTGWIAVVSQDSMGRNEVNIVFKIREYGALKVRRGEGLDDKVTPLDFAKKDEDQTVRFVPGYDKLALENFIISEGRTGALLSYDFKNVAGQPFTGRNYYLRVADDKVFVLRFTGRRNTLSTLRNQTDSIARSFKAK
ncbi:MAG TPA: hypothetical protein VJ302_35775 [Blastocatellia bacterium]|nr:hypothetical protein [Blastocatellia bacterium]